MIKKTTAPGASDAAEKAVPVNVLADPVVVKAEQRAKPKRSRKTKAEAEATAKRGRKPAAKTTGREQDLDPQDGTAKKAEGPKKPTALIIMDGFGHRDGEEAAMRSRLQTSRISDRDLCRKSADLYRRIRPGRRPAGRPDGQLRGRSHQYRCRPYRLSGADPHHQGHSGRRLSSRTRL